MIGTRAMRLGQVGLPAVGDRSALETMRFLFDSLGFVVVKGALSMNQVEAGNKAIDAMRSTFHERVGKSLRNSKEAEFEGDGKTGRLDCGTMLTWPSPHSQPFRDMLVCDPLVPLLNTVCGSGYRLDHLPLATLHPPGSEGFSLHGGTANPAPPHGWNTTIQYVCKHGTIRTSLVNVAYAFTPTPLGSSGGFCIVPGSHQANFPAPADLDLAAALHVPALEPGDAVVFTEAATHGALPWTGEDERRVVFYRYSPSNMAYGRAFTEAAGGRGGSSNGGEDGSTSLAHRLEDIWDQLTPKQRAVLQPPFASRLDRQTLFEEKQEDGTSVIRAGNPHPRSDDKIAFDRGVFGHTYF